MPKLGLCYISQNKTNLIFEYYFVQTKNKGFIRKIFGPKKEFDFDILGHYHIVLDTLNGDIKSNLVQSFADVITFHEKTKEQIYTNVYFDNDIFFKSTISLPKLSGKALTESFHDEFNLRYSSIIKSFQYITTNTVNDDKGITYDMLFYNAVRYTKILDIFNQLKITIDKCFYYPSIFASYFSKDENVDKNIVFFMFYNNYTKIVLGTEGVTRNCRFCDFGLADVNKAVMETCEVDGKSAEQYRHDNRRKRLVIQAISHSCKKLINEVLYSVVYENGLKNLDKIVLCSEDGEAVDLLPPFQRNFNGIVNVYANNKKAQIGALIDIALEKNKYIVELPTKVKNNENK